MCVNLETECKNVNKNMWAMSNNAISSQISFYMQIFRNLMTESCSHRTIEYTYGTDFPEFHIFKFFLKHIRLLWNFETASLLTPSLISENFNSIGSVVFEISHVKILKMRKSFIFDSSSTIRLNITQIANSYSGPPTVLDSIVVLLKWPFMSING